MLGEFREPKAQEGMVCISVNTAGLGAWDVGGTYRMAVEYPCVVRGEGVGRAEDGRRVYFGERSVIPFGAWAERTIVPANEVWDVPREVDDKTAIAMAIGGTGAWWPLEAAKINRGDNVLIMGATGVAGQLALQFARIMGASRIVGAGRDAAALARLKDRRIADATVQMQAGDNTTLLKEAAGEGFDVVLDPLCGEPLQAALKATRVGARIITMGALVSQTVNFSVRDLLFRTLSVVSTGQRPSEERQQLWHRLLNLTGEHEVTVDHIDVPFDRFPEAWALQTAGPHAKITASMSR